MLPLKGAFLMRFPTQVRYAVRAVVEIAIQDQNQAVPVSRIAESQGISPNYAKQLLNRLTRNGLLVSRKGVSGGYSLARKPESISLLDIYKALGMKIVPVPCLELGHRFCSRTKTCGARRAWRDLGDKIAKALNSISVGDIVDLEFSLKTRRQNR